MILVCVLFFFSGFAALVYELLWLRHLGLIFGNTVQAAATVMTAYMCGLAIGAHFSGKWAEGAKKPVQIFGFLEMGIGLYALCVPGLFAVLRVVYRFAYQNLSESLSFLTFFRFVLAIFLLLVPTSLMGATLPVLSKGFLRQRKRFGTRLGGLYGLNTLGAVTGVLSCGFVLIPYMGLTATNRIAIVVNLVVGILALVFGRSSAGAVDSRTTECATVAVRQWPAKVWLLLIAAGMSGFLSLAFEVVWFRALILVFGSTAYSFSAMLSVFLLGIALGALLLSWLADHVRRPVLLFAMAEAVIGAYTLWSMYRFGTKPEFLLRHLMKYGLTWGSMITAKFAIALGFLLVPAVLFGMAFTVGARAVRESLPSSPRTVGEVYTFNTAGAMLGAFLAGFVFLPSLGMEKTLMFLSFLALLLGSALSIMAGGPVWRRGLIATASLVCIGGVLVHPPCWDKRLLAIGPYFFPWKFLKDERITLYEQIQSERLLFYEEGITSTVSTSKMVDEQLYFAIDGKIEADTNPRGMVIQRMIGHLPMLFHPQPRSVLNIGLGAGVTLGALGCYPVDELDVVEIERGVERVTEIWTRYNHEILKHPKVHIIIGDGRNHLFCTKKRYDVITSDPFEPVVGGAANLFTIEHFQQARDRMKDGGIMCQWVPMYELSEQDFFTILRSFVHVFPESALFFTGSDIVMLGFNSPMNLNPAVVRDKFAIPAVRESLAEIGFVRTDMILGMFVSDMRRDMRFVGAGPLNTDTHPVIEFSAPKSALHYTPDANQRVLLDHFTDIPEEFFRGFTPEQRKVMLNGHEALRKTLRASIHRAMGRPKDAFILLLEAVQQAPDNPVIRNELVATIMASAQNMLNAREFRQASLQYQLALQYQPDEFWALYHLVSLSMNAGRPEVARGFLDEGLKHYPDSPLFVALRGKYRGTMGDIRGACDDFSRAIEQLPNRFDLWKDYAFFLEAAGNTKGARKAEAEVRRLKREI